MLGKLFKRSRDRKSAQTVGEAFEAQRAGDAEKARCLYVQALEENPDNADAYYLLGTLELDTGRHERALELIDEAIAREAGTAAFHYSRGLALDALGRHDDAEAALESALALGGLGPQAWVVLAQVRAKLGRPAPAVAAAWQAAVDGKPDEPAFLWGLADALAAGGDEAASREARQAALGLAERSVDGCVTLAGYCQAAGQLAAAADLWHRVLARMPEHPAARVQLGLALQMQQQAPAALEAFEAHVQRHPGDGAGWLHLSGCLGILGRTADACEAAQQAVERSPADPRARLQWASTLANLGRLADAERQLHEILARDPHHVQAHMILGRILLAQERLEEAEAAFLRANADAGGLRGALVALSDIYVKTGRLGDASGVLTTAIERWPEEPDLYINLGVVQLALNDPVSAEATLAKGAALGPDQVPVHVNHCAALVHLGRFVEAEASARRAMVLAPDSTDAMMACANPLISLGRFDEAVALLRQVVARKPREARAWSNLLMSLNYQPDGTPGSLLEEHRAFGAVFRPVRDRAVFRDPVAAGERRKLRIGYVSPDFRQHVVATFVEPVLRLHDRDAFEIYCYYNDNRPDGVTRRFRALADYWRDIAAMSDDDAERVMLEDKLDVVVDLAGHTGWNRLTVLSRRVAPVQVTWLGYPNGTGLEAMDWRLSDTIADPSPDADQGHFVERVWRLPGTFLPFEPSAEAPEVGPPPLPRNGHPTFCSFNNFLKVNPQTLRVWARILEALPEARLRIKTLAMREPAVRDMTLDTLRAAGCDLDRVIMQPPVLSYAEHLSTYGDVDVALDTFPYQGTTTTCEALWMGVPVVSRMGDRHAARVGPTLLHAVGLDECIATSEDDYVEKAVRLATDPARLAALRAGLRSRMRASVLCDVPGFVRNLEVAYREMVARFRADR